MPPNTNFGSAVGEDEDLEGDLQDETTPEGLDEAESEQPTEESFTDIEDQGDEESAALRKRLQADYTRKMQALAEERRAIAEAQVKAQNYDNMMKDPQALAQAAAIAGLQVGAPAPDTEEEDPLDQFDDAQADVLRKAMALREKAFRSELEKLRAEIAPSIQFAQQEFTGKLKKQIEDAQKKYPFARDPDVERQMIDVITKGNGLIKDPEQALFLVAGDKMREVDQRATLKKRTATNQRASIPDPTSTTRQPPPKKKPGSLYEALLQAQAEAGVNVVREDGSFVK